jgi:5-methylcytosine-specific restriction endonuclease McrA
MRKKTVRKPRANAAPKTRNNGTMTESAFWSFIRSGLRQKSRWWKPITQCKLNAKRTYKGPNKRQKFEYQCNSCKKWFAEKNINVDHVLPAGSLNCANDLPGFVERLFVEVEGLQILCSICHDKKTAKERESRL